MEPRAGSHMICTSAEALQVWILCPGAYVVHIKHHITTGSQCPVSWKTGMKPLHTVTSSHIQI
jgi:hypothetical protein